MSHRRLLILALVAGTPAVAAAQFTTFIPPVSRRVDSVATVAVVQQRARTDSIVNTQLTNIKAWVDSAAGAMAPMSSPAKKDTTADATTAAVGMAAATPVNAAGTGTTSTRKSPTSMHNGARAPETASALPLLVVAGLAGLGLGGLLVFGAYEPEQARSRA